jgi:pimeloyl-ACP methyl ester carboxylesterase
MSELTSQSRKISPVGLHVDDTGGPGAPVVLIHGWPMSAEMWQPQIGALTDAGHRVVAYDRRGFGRSDRPAGGYDYDTLSDDLASVLDELDLAEVTLVGFSMGGGEVARYIGRRGEARVRAAVFAAAVPPAMLRSDDNPDGPLTPEAAAGFEAAATADRDAFFEQFTTTFFSAHGELKVSEEHRQRAIAMCRQSDPTAMVGCMRAFSSEDFRADLAQVTVPTLVIHGDADAIVPIEGSGARTHAAIPHSEYVVLEGAPHGCTASHAEQFNAALVDFLARLTA